MAFLMGLRDLIHDEAAQELALKIGALLMAVLLLTSFFFI